MSIASDAGASSAFLHIIAFCEELKKHFDSTTETVNAIQKVIDEAKSCKETADGGWW